MQNNLHNNSNTDFAHCMVLKASFYIRRILILPLLLFAIILPSSGGLAGEIRSFKSDGCSLFPDGTLNDRGKWCDCCQTHDIAYWRGGTEKEREIADKALRDCVLERTGDTALAETMYFGVRSGGGPVFPTWYRWGYGWPYGRGYKQLSRAEHMQVQKELYSYHKEYPEGYCGKLSQPAKREEAWAKPLKSKYLENFYRIDEHVYRSAQPGRKGFSELRSLGIKNVLSLRAFHSDNDARPFGLRLYRVEMNAGDIVMSKVVEALRIIRKADGPILIHCWHGSDRTGLIIALYQIVFNGWSKNDAIEELIRGGYGYHSIYRDIPKFINSLDIEDLRKQVFAK